MTREHEQQKSGREPDAETNGGAVPPTREYHTDQITVQWYAGRCIHSGNCVRALPRVFDFRRRPWVDIEAANADTIARAVERCPSGALHYVRHGGGDAEHQDEKS